MEDIDLPQHFLGKIYELYRQSDLCDVTITATPGGEAVETSSINIHSVILAAHSPVFRTLFNKKKAGKNRWYLSVRAENVKHWRTLVKFMYSGNIDVNIENVDTIHQLAEAYGMERVKHLCEQFRTSHRDIKNINCLNSTEQQFVNLKEVYRKETSTSVVEVSFIKQEAQDPDEVAAREESCDFDMEVFYADAAGRTTNPSSLWGNTPTVCSQPHVNLKRCMNLENAATKKVSNSEKIPIPGTSTQATPGHASTPPSQRNDISLMMEVEEQDLSLFDSDTDNDDSEYNPCKRPRKGPSSSQKKTPKRRGRPPKLKKGYRRCSKCDFTDRVAEVLLHENSKHNIPNDEPHQNILTCKHEGCDFETLFESELKSHSAVHEQPETELCSQCGIVVNLADVLAHMQEHHPQCDECGQVCLNNSSLQDHKKTQHRSEEQEEGAGPVESEYLCTDCNYLAWNDFSLAVHMYRIHSAPLPHAYAEVYKPPPKRTHSTFTIAEKKEIVLYKDVYPKSTQEEIAAYFTHTWGKAVKRTTVRDILMTRDRWMNIPFDHFKRVRSSKYQELEEALFNWFIKMRSRNIYVSDQVFIEKAKYLGAQLNIDADMQYSNGWLARFKNRHCIVSQRQLYRDAQNSSASGTIRLDESVQKQNEKEESSDVLEESSDVYSENMSFEEIERFLGDSPVDSASYNHDHDNN